MAGTFTINVQNRQPQTQSFYFFQQPSIFSGGGQAYSNSLFSQVLASYDTSGAVMTFMVEQNYHAAIQQANSMPQVGMPSGFASASRAIELAGINGGHSNDSTMASVNPLGLSAPVSYQGVQPGAFRITTPGFTPPSMYNVGSAVSTNGGIILSNFVVAYPMNNTDCQPVLKFYVQTGTYMPGAVINFTQASIDAAMVDFTGGHSRCNVTLNADGTTQFQ
ncbi:hypothetical protein HGP17_32660 [Rhizobium sp. P38BS-XIX]|uniref:hypothetical protein n=1 Tax=Rhizobium sp. P38BS-XIX TaxID=2726740 RepID=UPI00145716FD|nr:hypothetical protein [Rhizobium sp. P38BS-XIX]NLS01612.1 hypothetical protein [Rhizobium sp. P38BS-XIX]